MNEKQILAWLLQAQKHAEMAWRKSGRVEKWGESEAYKEAHRYISEAVKKRNAANIAELDRKQNS